MYILLITHGFFLTILLHLSLYLSVSFSHQLPPTLSSSSPSYVLCEGAGERSGKLMSTVISCICQSISLKVMSQLVNCLFPLRRFFVHRPGHQLSMWTSQSNIVTVLILSNFFWILSIFRFTLPTCLPDSCIFRVERNIKKMFGCFKTGTASDWDMHIDNWYIL